MRKHSLWLMASILTGLLFLGNHAVAKKSKAKAKKVHTTSKRRHKGLPPKRTFLLKPPMKRRDRRLRHSRRRRGLAFTAFERRFPLQKWVKKMEKKGQKGQKKKAKKQARRTKKSRRGVKHK